MKQRQPFRRAIDVEPADAGHVAARPVETGNEASLDGVFAAVEDDRDRGGCRNSGVRRHDAAGGGDDIDLAAHQLGGKRRQLIRLAARPSVFDGDVFPLDITRLAQAFAKGRCVGSIAVGRLTAEVANHGHCCLLRAACVRPHRRTAESRYELPPSHIPPKAQGGASYGSRDQDGRGVAIDLDHLRRLGLSASVSQFRWPHAGHR